MFVAANACLAGELILQGRHLQGSPWLQEACSAQNVALLLPAG
jgi:hypothetical protein